MKNTILVPDLHTPFEHKDALAFICAVRDEYKTQQAISVGDELNFGASSFHDADPDGPSPGDELSMSIKKLADWRSEFPVLRLARSNHGDMLARKMFANGLPSAALRDYAEIYKTPKWKWSDEIIESMRGVNLVVRHSFGSNLRSALNRVGDCCIAAGHHHSVFGVVYRRNLNYTQWALATGCLIDPQSTAFKYNKSDLDRPMLGCGVVVDGQAIPVPMWLKPNGRWTGKVS